MLTAEAARLMAMEVLCPTAALKGEAPFPTMAGRRIFDSKAAQVRDLQDEQREYYPVAALYTRSAVADSRGEAAALDDMSCQSVLEVVAELATVVQPSTPQDDDEAFVDALSGDDARARLTLAAFATQIRWALLYSDAGHAFRRRFTSIGRIDQETHAIPEVGLRWQRLFIRFHLTIPPDEFDDEAGLPRPVRDLADELPADSYARDMLIRLGAEFTGQTRTPLELVTLSPPGRDLDEDNPDAGFPIPQGA